VIFFWGGGIVWLCKARIQWVIKTKMKFILQLLVWHPGTTFTDFLWVISELRHLDRWTVSFLCIFSSCFSANNTLKTWTFAQGLSYKFHDWVHYMLLKEYVSICPCKLMFPSFSLYKSSHLACSCSVLRFCIMQVIMTFRNVGARSEH
jgi:hypothetical protein